MYNLHYIYIYIFIYIYIYIEYIYWENGIYHVKYIYRIYRMYLFI